MLREVILTFESSQIKAIEQDIPVVLFMIL